MISIVVALAKNNVIGKKGSLPWYYPEDLKYFRKLTWGHKILMGRKTFESIINRNKKPLREGSTWLRPGIPISFIRKLR